MPTLRTLACFFALAASTAALARPKGAEPVDRTGSHRVSVDLGGTGTDVSVRNGKGELVGERSFKSSELRDLRTDAIGSLLGDLSLKPSDVNVITIGAAGGVQNGRVKVTQLADLAAVSKYKLRRWLGAKPGQVRVEIGNDMDMMAHSLSALTPEDVVVVRSGRDGEDGLARAGSIGALPAVKNTAFLAPGTGLGYNVSSGGTPRASEACHVDFPARGDEQWKIVQRIIQEKTDDNARNPDPNFVAGVSNEDVMSGRGFRQIAAVVAEREAKRGLRFTDQVEEAMGDAERAFQATGDRAKLNDTVAILIGANSENGTCELCREVVKTWVSLLGAAAGNYALTTLSGRVFIGGGIPAKNLGAITAYKDVFDQAFMARVNRRDLIANTAVYVIRDESSVLRGAEVRAAKLAAQLDRRSVGN